MNRRNMLGYLLSAFGIGATNVVAMPKEMVGQTQFIITLDETYLEPSDQFIAKIHTQWKKHFGSDAIVPLIVSSGIKIESVNQCTLGERLGEYEWKVVGRTPKETLDMLSQVAFGKEDADLHIVGRVE